MHAVELDAVAKLEYVPAAQLVHVDGPAPDHVPALHATQKVLLAAATLVEYVPALQLRQAAAAVAALIDEYVPETQELHCDEPDKPETADHVPAAQARQLPLLAAPTAVE